MVSARVFGAIEASGLVAARRYPEARAPRRGPRAATALWLRRPRLPHCVGPRCPDRLCLGCPAYRTCSGCGHGGAVRSDRRDRSCTALIGTSQRLEKRHRLGTTARAQGRARRQAAVGWDGGARVPTTSSQPRPRTVSAEGGPPATNDRATSPAARAAWTTGSLGTSAALAASSTASDGAPSRRRCGGCAGRAMGRRAVAGLVDGSRSDRPPEHNRSDMDERLVPHRQEGDRSHGNVDDSDRCGRSRTALPPRPMATSLPQLRGHHESATTWLHVACVGSLLTKL